MLIHACGGAPVPGGGHSMYGVERRVLRVSDAVVLSECGRRAAVGVAGPAGDAAGAGTEPVYLSAGRDGETRGADRCGGRVGVDHRSDPGAARDGRDPPEGRGYG